MKYITVILLTLLSNILFAESAKITNVDIDWRNVFKLKGLPLKIDFNVNSIKGNSGFVAIQFQDEFGNPIRINKRKKAGSIYNSSPQNGEILEFCKNFSVNTSSTFSGFNIFIPFDRMHLAGIAVGEKILSIKVLILNSNRDILTQIITDNFYFYDTTGNCVCNGTGLHYDGHNTCTFCKGRGYYLNCNASKNELIKIDSLTMPRTEESFPQFNSATYPSSSRQRNPRRCSLCNGTGESPVAKYPPNYSGSTHERKSYCSTCGRYMKVHYHESCPSCAGKGYN